MLFPGSVFRLEPYADPYYDYEIERFWRGGQYENFRVQYTETEPYHNYRVSGGALLCTSDLTGPFLKMIPFLIYRISYGLNSVGTVYQFQPKLTVCGETVQIHRLNGWWFKQRHPLVHLCSCCGFFKR